LRVEERHYELIETYSDDADVAVTCHCHAYAIAGCLRYFAFRPFITLSAAAMPLLPRYMNKAADAAAPPRASAPCRHCRRRLFRLALRRRHSAFRFVMLIFTRRQRMNIYRRYDEDAASATRVRASAVIWRRYDEDVARDARRRA